MSHIALYAVLGNTAYLLYVASLWMTDMRRLRVLAIASSACFIAYAALVPGGPLGIMIGWSLLFVGINLVRLFKRAQAAPLLVVHRHGDILLGEFTNVRGLRVMVVDQARPQGEGLVEVPVACMSMGAPSLGSCVDPEAARGNGVFAGYWFKEPVYAAEAIGRLVANATVHDQAGESFPAVPRGTDV